MSGTHLFRVILPVSDIEAASDFYTQVLGMSGIRVSGGRHYFDCGGTILLRSARRRRPGAGRPVYTVPRPMWTVMSWERISG